MKRTIKLFAILTVVTLGVFTSCIEDVTTTNPPVISITAPTADTTEVAIGDSLVFTLALTSETELASLSTTSGVGIELVNGSQTFTGLSASATVIAKVLATSTVGDVLEVNFTVANDTKQATSQKFIKVIAKETPLSAAASFEWKRVGGAAATGLEEFGLTWTSNTAEYAIIKKGAEKFVELDAATWASITNLEALKTAIDAGTDMEKWEKVSSQANKDYDFTLGTIKGGTYYLIHVTKGTVSTAAVGTTIVITGEYKK